MQSLPEVLNVLIAATSAGSVLGIVSSDFFDTIANSPWAYWVLALSVMITEELAPILAGIAANEGDLVLTRAIVAITLGGWVFTGLLYLMGRLKWEWIRRKWPKVRATGTVALRVVARNPLTASLFVRFAFGLRIVLPMACGAAKVPLAVFIPATFVGSAAWSILFTLIGYGAGQAAVRVIGHLGQVGEVVGALLVCGLLLLFLRWNRRRTERKSTKRHAAAKRAREEASKAVAEVREG